MQHNLGKMAHVRSDALFIMLYAVAMAMAMLASCYLLFRRGNAIAPDVTSSVCLRRWTTAFFTAMTLSHIWYLPVALLTSNEDVMMTDEMPGMH